MGSLSLTFTYILVAMFASISSFISTILSNPYLMIGVVLMIIGAGVSFLKRLNRV